MFNGKVLVHTVNCKDCKYSKKYDEGQLYCHIESEDCVCRVYKYGSCPKGKYREGRNLCLTIV